MCISLEASTENGAREERYFIYDGHGSTRLLTNENGAVTDRYSYDGYGNLLERKGNTENDFLYTGEQYNYLIELYYLRARYMDPSTGTFISMDSYAGTINDPVSLHKYLYANANPVMYRDPSGYMSMTEMAGSLAISAILTYSLATVFLHMMHVKVEEVPIIGDFYRLNRDVEDFIEVIKVEKEARIVIEVFPKLVFIKELFEVIYKTEFDFRNIEIFPAIEKKGPTILTIEGGSEFAPSKIYYDKQGNLTNGSYTINDSDMLPHKNGTLGKSQFLSDVDAEKAVLDAAEYADKYNLWETNTGNPNDFACKAKVYVENGPVGITGDGKLTNYINVYRTKTGQVHGCPGN